MLGFGHLQLEKTFNRRLTLTVLLIAVSQFNFGFDQQGFSSTQAMNYSARQFGKYDPEEDTYFLPTVWLSFFNGFMYVGQAFGVVVGSYISRRFGRRVCMFTMSLWAMVAATIVITSKTSNKILVGRVLNYIYIGMELAVVPVYQSEITPRRSRGFVIGTYQISLYLGGFVINLIARGTSTIKGNASWMIPYGLFYVVPTIVASLIFFVPESPRWLILKDRAPEALDSLRQLRAGKFSEDKINAEFQAILAGIKRETEKGTFTDIFRRVNGHIAKWS